MAQDGHGASAGAGPAGVKQATRVIQAVERSLRLYP